MQLKKFVNAHLKGCPVKGLFFLVDNDFYICIYYDADWAPCPMSWKSLMGFCIFLRSSLVSLKSKKQTIVSKSSTEAEHYSMATTVCELQWISYILQEFQIQPLLP